MADTTLSTYLQAHPGQGPVEGAVEVLKTAITGLETPTPPTGIDATQVQGANEDNDSTIGKPVPIGGKAVTASSYAPAYTANDVATLAVDKDSGGLLVSDRKKTRVDDAISADPKQLTVASTATPATTDATVFTLAAGEKGVIQNLSADAPLAYKYGASASTSSFNGVLNCGPVADDGKGGVVVIDDWIGAVSVAKITGTARYIAYKLS